MRGILLMVVALSAGTVEAQEAVTLVDLKARPEAFVGKMVKVDGIAYSADRSSMFVGGSHPTAGMVSIQVQFKEKSGPVFAKAMTECGRGIQRDDGVCNVEAIGRVDELVKGSGRYVLKDATFAFLR